MKLHATGRVHAHNEAQTSRAYTLQSGRTQARLCTELRDSRDVRYSVFEIQKDPHANYAIRLFENEHTHVTTYTCTRESRVRWIGARVCVCVIKY